MGGRIPKSNRMFQNKSRKRKLLTDGSAGEGMGSFDRPQMQRFLLTTPEKLMSGAGEGCTNSRKRTMNGEGRG